MPGGLGSGWYVRESRVSIVSPKPPTAVGEYSQSDVGHKQATNIRLCLLEAIDHSIHRPRRPALQHRQLSSDVRRSRPGAVTVAEVALHA